MVVHHSTKEICRVNSSQAFHMFFFFFFFLIRKGLVMMSGINVALYVDRTVCGSDGVPR